MKFTINQVSFGEDFLVDIGKNISFFRFKGIPEDMHLSISHDPSHRDLDFHATRNTDDGNKKPKIVIFKIDKTIAEAAVNQFGQQLSIFFMNRFLSPIIMVYQKNILLKGSGFFHWLKIATRSFGPESNLI